MVRFARSVNVHSTRKMLYNRFRLWLRAGDSDPSRRPKVVSLRDLGYDLQQCQLRIRKLELT
jgi:hypothetical protein